MDSVEEFIKEMYNTLVQIRYPKIITATVKNIESTILNGENLLALLSWLLSEKSTISASKFQKLYGDALEAAEILKDYSEIGICINKNILANCPIEEQLPTLKILLDFIKCVFLESSDNERSEKETIGDMLNSYINEDPNTTAVNIQLMSNYSDCMEYFKNLEKHLDQHQELLSDTIPEKIKENILEDIPHLKENLEKNEDMENESEIDKDSLFNAEQESFIEAFSSIGLQPIVDRKQKLNNLPPMDASIKDIHSNFSALLEFLQAKEEILSANVPKELSTLNTILNEIVKETVIHTEDARSLYTDNY